MRIRTEAGSGGRLGHFNMSHHSKTAFVKASARKARRAADKALAEHDACVAALARVSGWSR